MRRKAKPRKRLKTFRTKCHFRECTTVKGVNENAKDKLDKIAPFYDLFNRDGKLIANAIYEVYKASNEAEETEALVKILRAKTREQFNAGNLAFAKQLNLYTGQIDRAYKKKLTEKQGREAAEVTKEVKQCD